ncbi:hypothetical protein DITRI_Ditri11bG0080000 [Diplodiscus trichospermus]
METNTAVYSHLDVDEYAKQFKEFHQTKAGVKGIVDSGAIRIPRIFIHPPENRPKSTLDGTIDTCPPVPIIDFEGVRRFHEQTHEVKEEWYSDDETRMVRLCRNPFSTERRPARWPGTLVLLAAQQLEKEQVPQVCREAIIEYTKCVMRFKETVSELLSEALGLSGDCLTETECMDSATLSCHYYPPCPEPELTWGVSTHTDPNFLTFLLQDDVAGLQVLYQDQWVDVPTTPGALALNLGGLMHARLYD